MIFYIDWSYLVATFIHNQIDNQLKINQVKIKSE